MAEDDVTRWIESVEQGNHDAAAKLWEYCFPGLLRFAHKRLPNHLRRIMDEEDVALSAFKSFCLGAERGAFPELNGRDELWKLLVCLTARKAQGRIRHELREKRGGGKVSGESIFMQDESGLREQGIGMLAGSTPSPELIAQFSDDCQQLLDRLNDETLQAIALLRMEGYSVDEISQRIGCAKRSVERRLKLIRTIWSEATSEDSEN